MLRERLGKELLYFDGGMGTLLQERGLQPGELPETWNLLHAEEIREIHRKYIEAGSDIVLTNTFGANALKFHDDAYSLEGYQVYNPKAVVSLMLNGKYKSYWSNTGSYEAIVPLINMNFDGLRAVIGGMIPTFLLYKQLGLTNSFGVYVIPGMVSAFNMLVIRTYMNGISDSLEESVQQQPLLPCFQLFVFIHFYRNTFLPGLLLAE